jgi:tripartite-type tricarboxylate transporter receptor subunit TctC
VNKKHGLLLLSFFAALGMSCAALAADSWPNRPIKLIVPYPPGGSTDILTRVLAQKLGESFTQPIVIENRGGANGIVAANFFAKSVPDDHLFMVASLPMMAINQYLYPNLSYDPIKDFSPVGLIAQTPNIFVVAPSLPVRSISGLIDYAKANPGKVSYSSSGLGSAGNILNEVLKAKTNFPALHIPYRGNGPAMQALLAGDVQFTTDNLPQLLPHIKTGTLRPLAVTSQSRTSYLPNIPTVAEIGFPYLTSSAWFGVVAQSSTSTSVIKRLNSEMDKVLRQPEFIAKLDEISFEPMPGSSMDMLLAAKKARIFWKNAIEISGAKGE